MVETLRLILLLLLAVAVVVLVAEQEAVVQAVLVVLAEAAALVLLALVLLVLVIRPLHPRHKAIMVEQEAAVLLAEAVADQVPLVRPELLVVWEVQELQTQSRELP
jgi:hypothetical protein